ncbi:unnamed protein product [Toxocara canis]|uniref:Alba domain-containing protein n=1 Tax=Toxocara canis TaxID=6265 RepID=A0A183UEC5_TOXCA|nr:unnamed protein product [Toxocara canis]
MVCSESPVDLGDCVARVAVPQAPEEHRWREHTRKNIPHNGRTPRCSPALARTLALRLAASIKARNTIVSVQGSGQGIQEVNVV